jgi:general secretion pathway protein E
MQIASSDTPAVRQNPKSTGFSEGLFAHLSDRGLIDPLSAKRAEKIRAQTGERLDLVLTRLGLVDEGSIVDALSVLLGMPRVSTADFPEARALDVALPPDFLRTAQVVPIACTNGRVTVAMGDPFNTDALNSLAFLLNLPVDAAIATGSDVERAIERLYDPERSGRAAGLARDGGAQQSADDDIRRLEDLASDAPVIRLVNELITRAVEAQASDIHIEPWENCLSIRLRIDGVVQTYDRLPKEAHAAMASRIKIMAQLDIAERRLPQDGRINSTVGGRNVDLRVATIPTIWGENVVLRILNRSSVALDFAQLGFSEPDLLHLKRMLSEPNGMLLVTGPTGSGKTTTLYTALDRLNDSERKLFSVEDPVEYHLGGINQVQVNPRIGLTFSGALRSILRQDPDVIMIGEIRDLETAEIAVRASLTGHLVLSTLHTNSAAASITRMLDMGVEDYLLGSTLVGVLAQRLVRCLCPACRAPSQAGSAYLDRLVRIAEPALARREPTRHELFKAVGCPKCRGTGFSGRTTVYELLSVTDAVRDGIMKRQGERQLEETATTAGMVSMFANGLAKALAGETTVEEVLRVTRADDAAL